MVAGNCYYNCISGPLAGTRFNTVPGFSGTDDTSPASFMLSKDSPLIGAGVPLSSDDCTVDFFGNAIVSRNIGCYAGTGTDAPYRAEGFFAKLARFFRTLFHVVQNLITEGW